ncbi:hypothetical protein [Azohydromonas sp.]|uniref:hypothetical protein n=1 Tax=Azohydromonas sp. TaxID=1872666 RepID=UPI002B919DAD|nr:hypothetical protein [Azohydromonas sp.]HMM84793.1 hypothetical protein [Azohydromonas sp.]
MTELPDVAQIRYDNALRLFDEFVQRTVKDPDATALRGLERRFAERLQIQPSYWSQIKSRSRQIGERLARQFEILSNKPLGWMDQPHARALGTAMLIDRAPPADAPTEPDPTQPHDEDERFVVGLVLSYYRRDPQRARTRLLDLLGEVLTPAAPPAPPPSAGDERSDWQRAASGVAPLKRKR